MKYITALALGLFVAGCEDAYAENYNYTSKKTGAFGAIEIASRATVTTPSGMTLYTFDKDAPGRSNCYGDCAQNWPPYTASVRAKASGNGLSIIKRSDGTRQWAKDGAPLYLWVGDTVPGDTTGDGVGGVWHIAR
jgi:predicted lipoprotein with Yx(FWY)xxD motif